MYNNNRECKEITPVGISNLVQAKLGLLKELYQLDNKQMSETDIELRYLLSKDADIKCSKCHQEEQGNG